MKITRIEATSHRVPAKVPLLHEPIMREIVFVRVETDGGVTGYGLTGPIQRFAARELINREIAPLLLGKDPLATERHWYDLFYRLNPRAQTGAWSSAISAVDIALWDIKGNTSASPYGGCWADTVPRFPHTSPLACWSIVESSSWKRQSSLSLRGMTSLRWWWPSTAPKIRPRMLRECARSVRP